MEPHPVSSVLETKDVMMGMPVLLEINVIKVNVEELQFPVGQMNA